MNVDRNYKIETFSKNYWTIKIRLITVRNAETVFARIAFNSIYQYKLKCKNTFGKYAKNAKIKINEYY